MAAIVGSAVPDYRGRFLRHVGGLSAVLGGGQEDAGRNVTGTFGFWNDVFSTRWAGALFDHTKSGSGKVLAMNGNNYLAYDGPRLLGFDASRSWGSVHTAGEFRPTNTAVKYIVFAGNWGYPELAAIVGSAVPDYRGRFLRHVGGNSAPLGVAQGDAIRNIYGEWASKPPTYDAVYHNVSGAVTSLKIGRGAAYGNFNATQPEVFRFDASRIVPVATENRSVNMAVKWLIFAGN